MSSPRAPRTAVRWGLVLACLSAVACSRTRAKPAQTHPQASSEHRQCAQFTIARGGVCQAAELAEVSGIAAATTLPGALWAHNDSGDGPRLFALGRDGTLHGQIELSGAEAHDWEDLSAAPGTANGTRDLIIGDVGDNLAKRATVQLYRLPEPSPSTLGSRVAAKRYDVRYADGPVDVEAMFVDPTDGAVYLIAKSLWGRAPLYRVELRVQREPLVADPVGSVSVRSATAADMSADGSRLIVRNYRSAWLWERPEGASIIEMLAQPPCEVPLPEEPQGESIAFADAHTLLLLSETANQPVYTLREQADSPRISLSR